MPTLHAPVPFDTDTLTTQPKPKCVLAWAPHIHMDFCECPECIEKKRAALRAIDRNQCERTTRRGHERGLQLANELLQASRRQSA